MRTNPIKFLSDSFFRLAGNQGPSCQPSFPLTGSLLATATSKEERLRSACFIIPTFIIKNPPCRCPNHRQERENASRCRDTDRVMNSNQNQIREKGGCALPQASAFLNFYFLVSNRPVFPLRLKKHSFPSPNISQAQKKQIPLQSRFLPVGKIQL